MSLRTTGILLVGSVSLFRLLAALFFACLAFQDVPLLLISSLYGFAMVSDMIDGYLARKLAAETYFGKIIDLISDKSLTVVSLLYAAERGIDLFPLALIAAREILMIGARLITVEGKPLLPTSRLIGGIMALLLWGNTLFLICIRGHFRWIMLSNLIYWICAIVLAFNLFVRVCTNIQRIKASLKQDGI